MNRRNLNKSIAKAVGYKAPPKLGAIHAIVDGIRFDSTRESERYGELMLLQRAGEISDLHVHPQYTIQWPGSDKRICIVELDFRYLDKQGAEHIEDVKGCDTALSKLKRKLVEAAHGITVEVIK